jgi:hypothetical protein
VRGELGGEPRLADAVRARNEQDPATSSAHLPPRPSKPSELVLSIREGHGVVELRRQRWLRRRSGKDCDGPSGRARLEQLDGPVEALELHGSQRLERDVLDLVRDLRDARRHQDLSGLGRRTQTSGHVERDPAIPLFHRDRLAAVDPDADWQRELGSFASRVPARLL